MTAYSYEALRAGYATWRIPLDKLICLVTPFYRCSCMHNIPSSYIVVHVRAARFSYVHGYVCVHMRTDSSSIRFTSTSIEENRKSVYFLSLFLKPIFKSISIFSTKNSIFQIIPSLYNTRKKSIRIFFVYNPNAQYSSWWLLVSQIFPKIITCLDQHLSPLDFNGRAA